MRFSHKTYKHARQSAINLADTFTAPYGIRRQTHGKATTYNVIRLEDIMSRKGEERFCEVVEPVKHQ